MVATFKDIVPAHLPMNANLIFGKNARLARWTGILNSFKFL